MKGIKSFVKIGLGIVFFLVVGSSMVFAAPAKFPSKPIIFVCPGTVGGGSDLQARMVQATIEKHIKLTEPIVVLNKGGRGGANEAYAFTAGKKGDAHYVLTTANQFLTYPMTGAGYNPKDFTPIANLVWDPTIMVTKPDSPFKTFEDVVNAAKAKPDTLTCAGGQLGTQDHMGLLTMENAAGFKLRFVPFQGGGDIHRNVLGGQTDLAVGNPGDFIASIEAGKLKALIISTPKRSDAKALADVPTLKEKGYNATFVTWRGWFAPAGIRADQIKFLENMFKVVSEDAEFQEKYIRQNGMTAAFMGHEEFARFLKGESAIYEKLLRQSGVIK